MDIYERDWSSSCSGEWNADSIVDRALIKYQQSFAEAARALNMTCQNRLSLANPAQIEIADACTASAVKARQDALIGAAAANPILRERTVVTPTPADDPDSPIVAITFLERHEIGLCNSAPYPGWMVIELGLPERAPELKSSYFPPGSCRLDTIQYGGSTLAIRVAFQPDRNSAEFVQVVKAEDIATQWQAAGGFRPDSASSILRICSTPSGYVDIESRPNCDATHLLELAPIQWGFIPVDQSVSGTPRPVRRLFWEAYDPLVVGRMPAWLMDRPNERSNFFEALGETLRARASDPGNAHSRLLLGIGACEDDDPLELGVPVCSVEAQPPHGMAVPVRNGEIVTHVAGVPVFELGDMRRALRNLDEAMGSNYESVSVAIEIRVSSDASERLALTYWNPNYFQGCSEDAPFLTSLLNSVFAGIPGAISPNSYGQLLRIRQFCSDDFQAGNLLGMFAGFTGTLAKMGAGALGREAGKGALRWLSSRTGQMVMQSLDEVAYAFATAPKLQDFRETARDAGQGILLGVGIGVVTSARTRQ